MTFDKTWQLALPRVESIFWKFCRRVGRTVQKSRSTEEGISIKVPCGGEPSGHGILDPWINEQISEAASLAVSHSEHGLQISTQRLRDQGQLGALLCTA